MSSIFEPHSPNRTYDYADSRATGQRSELSKKSPDGERELSRSTATFMIIVATVAVCLSSYLSWAALTSSKVAGCGGGEIFDCSHVLQSKWSTFMGIPVGIPAVLLYVAMIGALVVGVVAKQEQVRQFALTFVSVGAIAAGLAAIWFISLQVFVVEHLCGYCLATHACGLILAAAVLWLLPIKRSRLIISAVVGFIGVSILATGQLVAEEPETFQIENHTIAPVKQDSNGKVTSSKGEVFAAPGAKVNSANSNDESTESQSTPDQSPSNVFEAPGQTKSPDKQTSSAKNRSPKLAFVSLMTMGTALLTSPQVEEQQNEHQEDDTDNESEERRLISINGGTVQLDVDQWPLAGSNEASQIFVEMFDYTCPHCRENHKLVKAAKEQLGDDIAVLALCVPMNSTCNPTVQKDNPQHQQSCEIARLAVAVWRVDATKFEQFHDWLFEGESAPSFENAKAQAYELVGEENQERLEAELADEVTGQYVTQQVNLYQKIGAGTVPKLLFPGTTVTGAIGSVESLIQVINKQE